MVLTPALRQELDALVKSADIVLFMKGTPEQPMCGFSASVVAALDEVLAEYRTINVLERTDIREGIKEYSSWPTIPQLYLRGELIGGADIVKQMVIKGELARVLGVHPREVRRPVLIVTKAAEAQMKAALLQADEGTTLRFSVDRGFQYELSADPTRPDDFVYPFDGFSIVIDRASAPRASNVSIDWAVRGKDAGFKITNPNEPPKVRTLTARELKARLDAHDKLWLFDVRTDMEIALARIEGARVLDEAADDDIQRLSKDAMLVFHCHHGQRSRSAAEHYLKEGYTNVYNLEGGIDAWSKDIDPSVPRY
ncbi:MAG: Grx4 family monothiol glutaredoxin [Myxococcota bacterium]